MLAVLTLSACGAGSPTDAGSRGSDARTVRIEMRNFDFLPATIGLRAGERVTLQFLNRSPLEHEFMAGQGKQAMGGYETDFFKDVEVTAKGGKVERGGHSGAFELEVAPHMGTAELTFVVPDRPGTYEIGCFIPGHYEAGMKGILKVE